LLNFFKPDITERTQLAETCTMKKAKVLLVITGFVFLVWALGILTRLWANPIFSRFWVASNNTADNLSYIGFAATAFFVGLALTVFPRSANSYRLLSTKQLKVKSTVLFSIGGIIFLVWSIGILTNFWANPIFGIFMIASNNLADILSYLGLSFGAFLVGSALLVYRGHSISETDRFVGLYPHRQLKMKSYDDCLPKNVRVESDYESNQMVIINGRQSVLGSEVMEKIVDK